MSMYDAFKTDPKKEVDGVLVEFGKFRTTVRRAGGANKFYQKTMEGLVAPYRRVLQLGQMQEATMVAILAEGYAKAIVTNWEYEAEEPGDGLSEPTKVWKSGIELPDGSMGDVTWENVKAVLIALPEVFAAIKEVAEAIRSFQSEADVAAKGKLSAVLTYHLVHGENEVQIATAAMKRRGDVPDFLKNAPQLEEGLDLFWDAFGVLTTERQIGQGVMGPIPWSKIMQYADRYELDFEQAERMVAYLREMDKVYLDYFQNRVKAAWQKTSQPSSPTSKS